MDVYYTGVGSSAPFIYTQADFIDLMKSQNLGTRSLDEWLQFSGAFLVAKKEQPVTKAVVQRRFLGFLCCCCC